MMRFWKITLPLIVAFALGVTTLLLYYIPHQTAEEFTKSWIPWYRIIIGFAIVLGIYSLFNLHYNKIKKQGPGWGYSIFVFAGFFVTIFLGFINEFERLLILIVGGPVNVSSPFGTWKESGPGVAYQWVYDNIFTACGATIFSILAFFIASAAYRTFRARSPEAGVLLISAVIVMLGVTIGSAITPILPDTVQWLMEIPNTAATRGILLGICLGSIATSLRIIFGIERGYLGGGE